MEKKNMTTRNILLGLLLGCLAGGLAALFSAPQSGTQTRHLIQEKGEEMMGKSAETIHNTRGQVANTVTSLRQARGF